MATFTWGSTISGDWNTTTNWTPNGIPNDASAVADFANSGTYVVSIASGASDTVSGITITAPGSYSPTGTLIAPTLEVAGTLDLVGAGGTISQGVGDLSVLLVNGGTIDNGGAMDPLVEVTNVASFVGTNVVDFTNQLEVLAGSTAVVAPTGGIEGLSGSTLAAGVYNDQNGTIDIGGGSVTANIVTLSGNNGNVANVILDGTNAAIEEWTGTAYQSISSTVATITAGGTLQSLNRDYSSSNNILLDNGAMIFSNDTVTTGTVTINANGRYLGNNTTVTNDLVNNGTVQVGSGIMVLDGSLGGTGTLAYYPQEDVPPSLLGTIEVTGATANNVELLDGRGLQLDDLSGFSGTVNAPVGSNIILHGITANSATLSGDTLSVMQGTSVVGTLTMSGTYTGDVFDVSSVTGGTEISVAQGNVTCFARGTRIRTPDGEVAVEDLAVGQLVLTASGETAPVVWIGRRRLDCQRHPAPRSVLPVRVRAGAFAPQLPQRDLLLSPQHAIFDEGVLIPVRYLINGSTVVQEQVAEVEYFHVELPQHDVLLAEGLPTESYLENNDRDSFENGGGAMLLHPDFSRWNWDGRACAELKVVGPQVDAVRAKLEQSACGNKRRAA